MLKINDLSFSYGDKKILNELSLSLPSKGVYAITGPSGCGKTTLFMLIASLIKPDSGSIESDHKRLSFVFQEARLLPWLTAAENVNFALGGKKSTLQNAIEELCKVGLSDDTKKYPHELSGGMQRRVSLARAFAYDGDIILLDEPTAGLDEKIKAVVLDMIKEKGEKSLVLMITHDIDEAKACANEILDFYEIQKG